MKAKAKEQTRCVPRQHLRLDEWPDADRTLWAAAFRDGDRFDDWGPAAHLAERTRRDLRYHYGSYLYFVAVEYPDLLDRSPSERVTEKTITSFVANRRETCHDRTIADCLLKIRCVMRFICPADHGWSWLAAIAKRILARSPPRPRRHHLITSETLYALGLDLMDRAIVNAPVLDKLTKAQARQYRDGLIIALLALIPLRRRTLASLRIGKHLIKSGSQWTLDIPAEDTKSGRALDYPVSPELSERIDLYLAGIRNRIPGAASHDGLWASDQSRKMDHGSIYLAVCKRTKLRFGFSVNLHRFRHAAATFWSVEDPANVRGVKDLLGHSSFRTTETSYIMSQSRVAGRFLARAIGCAK